MKEISCGPPCRADTPVRRRCSGFFPLGLISHAAPVPPVASAHTPTMRVVNAKGAHLLTPREEQVVALVAEGLTNKDIACELALSENTIKKYCFRSE